MVSQTLSEILTAEKNADEAIQQANKKSEQIISDANQKADEIIQSAKKMHKLKPKKCFLKTKM